MIEGFDSDIELTVRKITGRNYVPWQRSPLDFQTSRSDSG
jgi:hypothetical protein